MTRFYGEVGYGVTEENPSGSGKHVPVITEQAYYGEITRITKQHEPGEKVNSDLSAGVTISILADQYATEHFLNIKYLRWEGVLWTVTNVKVQRPRLIIEIGGVYNGPSI